MTGRHEIKHSLNYGDYIVLRDRLKIIMNKDPNANENGEYKVRSLYFDTSRDKALMEKINGVNKREKFRIRKYMGNDDFIMLEKKSKIFGLCYKQQARLTIEEVEKILNNDVSNLAFHNNALIREFHSKISIQGLTPKTIVDYIREPFICPEGNVRITFDRDIQTGISSTDFLNDNLATVKAGDEIVLLEVKFDQFIPSYITRALNIGNRRSSSCSKYALCRAYG